jgi:hypothetical protein
MVILTDASADDAILKLISKPEDFTYKALPALPHQNTTKKIHVRSPSASIISISVAYSNGWRGARHAQSVTRLAQQFNPVERQYAFLPSLHVDWFQLSLKHAAAMPEWMVRFFQKKIMFFWCVNYLLQITLIDGMYE